MLVTGLLKAFFYIANAVVKAFPQIDLTWVTQAGTHVGDALGIIHRLDAKFPIVVWFTVLGIYAGIWGVIGVVVALRKVYSLVAGGGGV